MYYLDSIIVNLVSAFLGAFIVTIYKSRKYLKLLVQSYIYIGIGIYVLVFLIYIV